VLSEKCERLATREYVQAGDLETWKLIPEMYKTLDQKEAQLYMCASFAAPFMRLGVGTAKNLILNIWDPRGGKGKSTLLQAVNSVWGHPSNLTSSKSDTLSARFQVLAARKNLPFCMDELTTMQDNDLSPMLFDIANGQEKRKSNRTGTNLIETGTWETITFLTSNRSIYELMQDHSAQTTAESMRVVEVPCGFKNYSGTELGAYIEDCIYLMKENYGLAGPSFIAECMAIPNLFESVAEEARAWDQSYRYQTQERFWSYGLGLILAVGRLAVKMGYLNYDMDALERWVVGPLLTKLRLQVHQNEVPALSLFGEYLGDNIGSSLVVESAPGKKPAPDEVPSLMSTYVKHWPIHDFAIRLELEERLLYITPSHFANWCKKKRISASSILEFLRLAGAWDGRKVHYDMGAGVESLPTTRTLCYCFHMHEDLGFEFDSELLSEG
jgi:hypothetical protein